MIYRDSTVLQDELSRMDLLAGASGRSIQSLEALWPDDAPVPWTEAYNAAQARQQDPGADRQDGRTVAFLEGMLAAHAQHRSAPSCG